MDAVLLAEQGHSSVFLPGYKDPSSGEMLFQHPSQEEIDEHDTEFLRMSLMLWATFKRCGLPHGKGWYDERPTVIAIINILDNESNRYERWAMKNRDLIPDDDED